MFYCKWSDWAKIVINFTDCFRNFSSLSQVCFILWLFLRKVNTIFDMVEVVDASSKGNTAVLVGTPSGRVKFPTYDWKSYFDDVSSVVNINIFKILSHFESRGQHFPKYALLFGGKVGWGIPSPDHWCQRQLSQYIFGVIEIKYHLTIPFAKIVFV